MIASLLISWLAVTWRCDGSALLTPVDHYEVQAFQARVIGSHLEGGLRVNDFGKALAVNTAATSIDLTPKVGDVVGWDGMWDASWTVPAPPPVVAVTLAGNRSDEPCR